MAGHVDWEGPVAGLELYARGVSAGDVEGSGTLAGGALGADAHLLTVLHDALTVHTFLHTHKHITCTVAQAGHGHPLALCCMSPFNSKLTGNLFTFHASQKVICTAHDKN